MKLYKATFIILITFLSDKALAEWENVANSVNGDKYYVDFDLIRKSDGLVNFWLLNDYAEVDDGNRSASGYFQADCDVFRKRVLTYYFYTGQMGKGESYSFKPSPGTEASDWIYPNPGSVFASSLEAVCKK